MPEGRPISIAVRIEDRALADQLRTVLEGIPGIRLADPGTPADVALVPARPAGPGSALSARETEVLALLAEGASNKAIARRLGISAHTVKFHVASLLDKLDAVGRTDAVAHAARLGVIQL